MKRYLRSIMVVLNVVLLSSIFSLTITADTSSDTAADIEIRVMKWSCVRIQSDIEMEDILSSFFNDGITHTSTGSALVDISTNYPIKLICPAEITLYRVGGGASQTIDAEITLLGKNSAHRETDSSGRKIVWIPVSAGAHNNAAIIDVTLNKEWHVLNSDGSINLAGIYTNTLTIEISEM